jgi:hypothetical protein
METSSIGFSPELISRARQNVIDRSAALLRESRELIERSRTLLLEYQQQSEEPRFSYRRDHLKLASWQSAAPCCSVR